VAQVAGPATATHASSPAVTPAPPVVALAASAAAPMPLATREPVPQVSSAPPRPGADLQAALARTQSLLQRTDLGGYTIQLAALPSAIGLNGYLTQVASQLDASKVFVQHSVYKGKIYVSIYYGHYDSHRAAALAIESLPAGLKGNRPLVRTWAKVKQDQQP
jgi:septal ring-binding cell division protein DamX